jgi:hypothetical protein
MAYGPYALRSRHAKGMEANPMKQQFKYTDPWWLIDADRKTKRKFEGYEAAKAAGIRAYWRKRNAGFYAEDSFHLLKAGEYYSVASMIEADNERN